MSTRFFSRAVAHLIAGFAVTACPLMLKAAEPQVVPADSVASIQSGAHSEVEPAITQLPPAPEVPVLSAPLPGVADTHAAAPAISSPLFANDVAETLKKRLHHSYL
jgi:hypothetical protein